MFDHTLLADKYMEDLKSSWLSPTDLVFRVWLKTMYKIFLITRVLHPALVQQVFPALQNTSLESLDKVYYCT
jgi:uncharacterized protein (UPF0305 family)